MKKIKKRLNNAIKILLACGMFFNNLMPLSVVFADETDNNVVVGENNLEDGGDAKKENPTVGETGDGENNVDPQLDPTVGTGSGNGENTLGDGTSTEVEVKFEVSINGNNIIIKHTGAGELSGDRITISESFKYANGVVDDIDNYIELTEDNKNALASDDGYSFSSDVLNGNVYEGEYTATVTADEEEKTVSKTFDPEGEGIELKVYTSDGQEVTENDGVYNFQKGVSAFVVTARLLNGGISPDDTVTIGGEEFMAYELFEEGQIAEEVLNGYLYGTFEYNLSFDYMLGESSKTVNETFVIMYGTYQDNTDVLNESAKNVELDDTYKFFGDSENGIVYVLGEFDAADLEEILGDAIGESEVIEYTINQDDGLTLILTDSHGVTITYSAPEFSEDTTIDNRLELGTDGDITSGSEFTVKYLVKLKEYAINGVSGIVNYDEDLLKIVSVTSDKFEGNNSDNKFLFLGEDGIKGSVTTDDEGIETINEEEYIIVTITFKALKAGNATISVDDSKFYNGEVYYEGAEVATLEVEIIEGQEEPNDSLLSSLTVAGQSILLEDGQYNYEIKVGNDVTKAIVDAVLANENANITLICPEELVEGENTIIIEISDGSGEPVVYTITVIREASQSEETTSDTQPVVYQEYTSGGSSEPEVVVTPGNDEPTGTDVEVEEKDTTDLSRIIVVILILLVIAGLIYLIFKDEDDEETKKANKEIDKLKKEDKPEEKSSPNRNNNQNRNNKNNNKKGR